MPSSAKRKNKKPKKKTASRKPTLQVPPAHDWRTTDEDEINRRRLRAETEPPRIANLDPRHRIFSNFKVHSSSGLTYQVEVRDIDRRQFSCNCVDFRINGLGTCKHVEAVLNYLERRHKRLFKSASRSESPRIDLIVDPTAGSLRLERGKSRLPPRFRRWFDSQGFVKNGSSEALLAKLRGARLNDLRISQEVDSWLAARHQVEERKRLRREYEQKVQSGEWPAQETTVPLYPYQREGMLHLAFTERALLADEMGLGKTIQAIAACALLHRLGKVQRVLVVTPASLKSEWEEQIQRFTGLPLQLVYGARPYRLKAYENPPFFTIVNYEQMLSDVGVVNDWLQPDAVILDEAQRIKNWTTKTAQAVKRLNSRYAFVLTGTPIENRIDELYSLMDFLNPGLLGPLFRFNREFYELDERGKPIGYKNLDRLHDRIRPFMLRRRKSDVEAELPERTDKTYFVSLSGEQQTRYAEHEANVARLMNAAKRRPLTQQEQDRLMRELAMMRMVCDSNYILDPEERACPKLYELEKILDECRDNPKTKLLIFSEWERMLELVRELCDQMEIGYAWHTGSVSQRKRRGEINLFKNDPECRVFLSTDSGSTGLNLQDASVVINCDLPWNPAKLEQRIARAWRKHQSQPVTVIQLVAKNTIEQRMLETLATKRVLADGVLDRLGDVTELKIGGGRQAFLEKLNQLLGPERRPASPDQQAPRSKPLPADRPLAFSQQARERLGDTLVRCEERYPEEGAHSVLVAVVEGEASQWQEKLSALHGELFGPGNSDPLAPVRLEVIDRKTDETLQRLIQAGLISSTTRAIRALDQTESAKPVKPALSAEEQQEAARHRQQAARKLKMSQLLAGGGLFEEAGPALQEAVFQLGHALAIENQLPKPREIQDTVAGPMAYLWGESMPKVREFIVNGESEPGDVGAALQTFLRDAEAQGDNPQAQRLPG